MEIDITCLVETCVNWRRNKLRKIYKQLLLKEFKNSDMSVTTTPQEYLKRYLPGGAATISSGKLSKNIKQHIYDDKNLGRWCGTNYNLDNKKQLHILSAYRVCQQNVNKSNSMSTYSQQFFMMKRNGIENPNPREAFITDFGKQLGEICNNPDNYVIICIDANENMEDPSSGIKELCTKCGLIDIFETKHEDCSEFSTHINGSKKIDYMLGTPNILRYVHKIGYLPFHDGMDSDHRSIFCDLSDEILNIKEQIVDKRYRLVGTNSTNKEG
jgi:hypothetical protein